MQIARILLIQENKFTEEKRRVDKSFYTNDRYWAPPCLKGSDFRFTGIVSKVLVFESLESDHSAFFVAPWERLRWVPVLAGGLHPAPFPPVLSYGRSGVSSFPREPEPCSVGRREKGRGLWLFPGTTDRGHQPGLGQWAGLAQAVGQEHMEKHPLTFHVGGNRQKQIFHGLIKSFKLTKFL